MERSFGKMLKKNVMIQKTGKAQMFLSATVKIFLIIK